MSANPPHLAHPDRQRRHLAVRRATKAAREHRLNRRRAKGRSA